MARYADTADHDSMADHPDPMPTLTEPEWLRRQIARFEQRLRDLDGQAVTTTPATSMPPPPMATPAPPPPSIQPAGAPDRQVPVAPRPPWLDPPTNSTPSDRRQTSPAATTERPAFSLPAVESLLKWSGLVLMFLSALFLVSTAIQRGWIGPELQLLGAGAIGASLIAGGLVIGQYRSGWDVPLVAVGLATLSATTTAGWTWLELWSHQPWIVASIAVLGFGTALSARLNSPGVATTGLATTAVSIGLLAPTVTAAAMLLALVVVVGEAASLWRRWASLHLLTVTVGLISFGAVTLAVALADGANTMPVLASGAVATLAFWLMPMAWAIRGSLPTPSGVNWRPTADRLTISLPVLFTTAWAWSGGLSDTEAGRRMLVVGCLALASSLGVAATRRFATPIWISQLMGGAAAIAVGSVLLFEGPALLIGVAVQAAALVVFVHLVPDRWATIQAGFMATIAALLALAGMIVAIDANAPVIDDLAHLTVIGLFAAWTWWQLRRDEDRQLAMLLAGVTFGGLVLWPVSALTHVAQGQALVSAAWAALGFVTLVAAFGRSSIRLAQLSLATLAVVMVKLLSVDLAAVDTFWRVALFFVLGGAFLVASFRVGSALRPRAADAGESDEPEGPGPGQTGDGPGAGGGGPDQVRGLAFQK